MILKTPAIKSCFNASFYSATAALARTWPALFPGHELPGVSGLPGPISTGITSPGTESVFNKPVNLLIMGIDKRPGDRFLDAYRTDVVMVANIDAASAAPGIPASNTRELAITPGS